MNRLLSLSTLALTFVLGSACGGGSDAGPAKPDEKSVAKAEEIFVNRCTPCHGAEGRGDGSASAQLSPKPRNFHDATWQASVKDDHIMRIIRVGGQAVGKSPAMPSNPDLNDAQVLAALKDKIRGFSGK